MNINDVKTYLLNSVNYDSKEFKETISLIKHNICQNMRIARKLSNISPEKAAQLLSLEPQSLRRIEAVNDRDEFSTKVLILAIVLYNQDANFYFNNWKENEKYLDENNNITDSSS